MFRYLRLLFSPSLLQYSSSSPSSLSTSHSHSHSSSSLSSSSFAWALITGSSDGIGKEFAIELAREYGFNIIIHGRNKVKLEAVRQEILAKSANNKWERKIEVKIIVCDASQASTLDFHSLFVQPLSSLHLTLLINNVGVICEGGSDIPYVPATDASDNDVISVINVNNLFLTLLTKHMVPLLAKHKKPSLIINISSTLSLYAMPYIGYYSASKAFVNSFSDVLNRELAMDPETKSVKCESLIVGSVKTAANRGPSNFFHPTAETYARSACRLIGDGTKEGTGYIAHAIELLMVWLMPTWMANSILAKAARFKRVEYQATKKSN